MSFLSTLCAGPDAQRDYISQHATRHTGGSEMSMRNEGRVITPLTTQEAGECPEQWRRPIRGRGPTRIPKDGRGNDGTG